MMDERMMSLRGPDWYQPIGVRLMVKLYNYYFYLLPANGVYFWHVQVSVKYI